MEKASLVDEGRYDIVASILTPFVYYEYYMLKVNHAGQVWCIVRFKLVEREREKGEKPYFHSSNLYLQLRDIYIQG